MTLEEAKKDMERFVTLKTSMRPAFVDVLLQAQEIKRGEWKRDIDNGAGMLRCSVCECRAREEPYRRSLGTKGLAYCPYCGAKMEDDVILNQISLFEEEL
jgi:hypothetical protein